MKRVALRWSALLAMFAVVALLIRPATAQDTATKEVQPATKEATPRVNTAVVPQLSPRMMNRHTAFLEIAKQGDIDVLFMGDSITDFWRTAGRGVGLGNDNWANAGKPVFDKYFGSMKVANFGISGDTTQGVLWRLQNGEGQGYRPKAVMLMIGTNNTRANTGEEIAEGVTAVVRELQKDFPEAKILLLAIFPRDVPDSPSRKKIAEINKIIAQLDGDKNVTYLDIGGKFLAEDGAIPKDVMVDGLHPTTKGYEIWAEAVKEPLAKMLGDASSDK